MEILLAVSRGSSFEDAVRLAIDTAKAHGGRVRVLNVVDAAEIRRIEAGARPGGVPLARDAARGGRERGGGGGGGAGAGVRGGGRVERPPRLGGGLPLRPRPGGRSGTARPGGDEGGRGPGPALPRALPPRGDGGGRQGGSRSCRGGAWRRSSRSAKRWEPTRWSSAGGGSTAGTTFSGYPSPATSSRTDVGRCSRTCKAGPRPRPPPTRSPSACP